MDRGLGDRARVTRPRLTARVRVRLTPGAGNDRVDGVVDGALWARVAARAVDGAANAALTRLLAAELGVAPTRVEVVRGQLSRTKLVAIDGLDPAVVRSRWPGVDV